MASEANRTSYTDAEQERLRAQLRAGNALALDLAIRNSAKINPRVAAAQQSTDWGSPVERERWRRIKVSIAAYAYEARSQPIMSDAEFDELAYSLNPRMPTGHATDVFFARHFDPSTGMWVHQHPELGRIIELYERHHGQGRA